MATERAHLTLEDFLRLPEQKPALEYVDGEVRQKVSPQGKHSRLQGRIESWFNAHCEPRELAMAFVELRITVAGESRVTDVAAYRWERIPFEANGDVPNVFTTPPDVVVEVLSPGQRLNTVLRDAAWYTSVGVPLTLVIDEERRTVRVLTDDKRVVLRAGDTIDFGAVLPELTLAVDTLFGWLKPRTNPSV